MIFKIKKIHISKTLWQIIVLFTALVTSFILLLQPANALLEKLLPQSDIHIVQAIDRDVAFVIDGFIYDAQKFCYLQVGDKVIFLQGHYGSSYRAKIYNLTGKESCNLLLRERYIEYDDE